MFKKLAICSLTAVMFGASSVALAHTGVKDAGTEGKTLYTAFTIGHGCTSEDNPTPLPVVAQAVLFPNAADSKAFKLTPSATAGQPATEESIDLSTIITGGAATLTPVGIKDLSLFKVSKSITQTTVVNGLPKSVVRGFKFKEGLLDVDMIGLPPFRMSGIKFAPTSCAKSLKIRIAIANWCNLSQDKNDDRRVDMWMGHMTTKYNDEGVMPHPNADGSPSVYWPTLTINRDLTANPLPADCGTGYDVAVQPSDADIDVKLRIKGYWPNP